MSSDGVLLIDDGDLPSLVGLALERDPTQLVLWHAQGSYEAAARRLAAVHEHREAFGVQRVVVSKGTAVEEDEWSSPAGRLARSVQLLCAVSEAVRSGCSRIVWPIQLGSGPTRICLAVEQANMVIALAEIGSPATSLMIDLPLVDLGESQIVDLAVDQGVLGQAFWPCETGSADRPCGACPGCRRWAGAFETQGRPWPRAATSAIATV